MYVVVTKKSMKFLNAIYTKVGKLCLFGIANDK